MGQNLSNKTCCSPRRNGVASTSAPAQIGVASRDATAFETVQIPGGAGFVGTKHPCITEDGEGPMRRKRIRPFRIAPGTVTNTEFAVFVAETNHVTVAEEFGWSFVFWSQVPEAIGTTRAVQNLEWWRRVDGACWSAPQGLGSEADPDHPVVHIAWQDACAYAAWAGGALPTEAEWEHAARGGKADVPYPWGDRDPDENTFLPCNIWQGNFPHYDTGADGYCGTAPARSFEPNGYGLYHMVGNVWEWTDQPFGINSLKKDIKARLQQMKGFKLLKGGSFLCHRSYCYRYRIAARIGNSPESTTTHQGFRVVWR